MDLRLIDLSAQCVVCQEYKPLDRKSKFCAICGVTVCKDCIILYDKKINLYRFRCPICKSGPGEFRKPMFRYEVEKFIRDVVTDINWPIKSSK